MKKGFPVNAMKIGEFNDNDPIFICCDYFYIFMISNFALNSFMFFIELIYM